MGQVMNKKTLHIKSFFSLLKMEKLPVAMVAFVIALSLVETAASLVVPLVTKNLVDMMSGSGVEKGIIFLLLGAFIVQTVAGGISFYFLSYIGENVVAGIRRKLWGHILHL